MPRTCKVLSVTTTLLLAACGGSDRASGGGAEDERCAGSGEVLVAAASSLTDAFEGIATDLEAACPDIDIAFTFDSSATLSTQILDGAPVDVFASADQQNMERVSAGSEAFAGNELVIVTKPRNPEGIGSLADLVDAGVVALCAEDAPCGRIAGEVLADAGIEIPESAVTRGQNARATLTAVSEGDATAAIVYATDARSAGEAVETVPIPADQNATATYPIAALDDDEAAATFVAWVLGEDGQARLAEQGFLPAP